MYNLVLLLVFVTAVIIFYLLLSALYYRKKQVSDRLLDIRKMEKDPQEEDALRLPFYERVIDPLFIKLGNTLGNLAPKEMRVKMENRIIFAGKAETMSFNNLMVSMLIYGVLFFSLAYIISSRVLSLPGMVTLLFLLAAVMIGCYFPLLILKSKADSRQKDIQKSLPEMLDLLLVSVEAGLGFDMAMKRVTEKMPGELSKEFTQGMEEIRRGKPREEALRGIAKRTGVKDLSSFITAVIQSEQLGSNIANTLRIQAQTMRQKRRQRAEETAMKAPIKMLFPMIFFILPTLFVVILGPAMINIMKMFADM